MQQLQYKIRCHKHLRRICKLLLNLSILALLGFLIWSGILLFTKQSFVHDPLVGSLIFIASIVLFIWLSKIGRQNSWQPSMKYTVLSLIGLFLIFSFVGIQPLAHYKDVTIERVTEYFSMAQDITEDIVENTQDTIDNWSNTSIDDYANKFNEYRRVHGLASLEFTEDLNIIAQLRLHEIYTDFSHYSAGSYNQHLAENIAVSSGFLSNSDALSLWQNSPGHNANMLDPDYKYTGYAIDNGHAVQVFTEYPTINGEPQLPPGWYWNN